MTEKTTVRESPKLPPGPRGLPIFGSLLSMRNDPHLAINRITRQYGDVCMLKFGNVPTVVISHPDLLKEAFSKTELSDRWVGEVMDILSHHGSDLAMAPYGEHWRNLSRFANREMLSARRLQQIRELYVEDVVNDLVKHVGELSDSGESIRPLELLTRSNSMIMFRSIFGRSSGDTAEFDEKREELLDIVYWFFSIATATNPADYIPFAKIFPNNTAKEARRRVPVRDAIIEHLIADVRSRPDFDLQNPTCLADLILAKETAGEIEHRVVILLILDLLFAGIDTSANTVTWLVLLLANRPEVQDRIHEEMANVIGSTSPTVEDRERMPYFNSVILESMRYRTVGPLALPHKAGKTCEVGGFTIPQGAQVLGNTYSIHHDPRFWESPNEFVSERFMPLEDGSPSSAMTSNAFIPFGVGRRGCPGVRFGEILIWMHASRLLHKYRFEPVNGPLSEAEVFGLTVGPKPFELKATRFATL